ncbi:hypothetical protein GGX14DRAFT_391883 [Mycena pura]|uniref:Uncharacterized protein n=1 Tax=Mycena pura TaxID=153505 RepID=A0AAD6YG70_9AGAR|nr:hypothetical protein GGX14DRAFT_391883 [Mycena pura]
MDWTGNIRAVCILFALSARRNSSSRARRRLASQRETEPPVFNDAYTPLCPKFTAFPMKLELRQLFRTIFDYLGLLGCDSGRRVVNVSTTCCEPGAGGACAAKSAVPQPPDDEQNSDVAQSEME